MVIAALVKLALTVTDCEPLLPSLVEAVVVVKEAVGRTGAATEVSITNTEVLCPCTEALKISEPSVIKSFAKFTVKEPRPY